MPRSIEQPQWKMLQRDGTNAAMFEGDWFSNHITTSLPWTNETP
jgi:hypothetical protein